MKCARTACEAEGLHPHSESGRLYCLSCARKINEFAPDLIRVIRTETKNGPRIVCMGPDGKIITMPMPPANVQNPAPELAYHPVVYNFDGFLVLVAPAGCVLVLPSNLRESIGKMEPGQDRLVTQWSKIGTTDPPDEDVFQGLRAMSMEWIPKENVP